MNAQHKVTNRVTAKQEMKLLVTDFSLVEIYFDLFEKNELVESNYITASEKEVLIYRLLDYGFLSQ